VNETLDAALALLARGWSILALCPHDHVGVGRHHMKTCKSPGKRPWLPTKAESAQGEWKEYQTGAACESDVREWWHRNPRCNLGVALGPVSGLAAVDVDCDEGDLLLTDLSGGDLPPTWEYTTGKGRRLLYALPEGASVITQTFKRPGTEIEILRFMGHGGQVVLPPSTHPNGSTYRWKAGHAPGEIDCAPVPQWLRGTAPTKGSPAEGAGELIAEGGRNNYLTSLAGAMRKRGCEEDAIYAALDVVNRTRFEAPLDDAEVRSVARSVSRYEADPGATAFIGAQPVAPSTDRKFKWASELTAPPRADEWLWRGYLPAGGITLLSALWKAGKTTLLAHLLRALSAGGEFLGQPIRPARVLYISEEGERHWVRRRDDLALGDHVGFYLQPFASKPAPDLWGSFIAQLKVDVETHHFDLVVFDTLAKLWPVAEENDAGSVDAALMPLWELTRAGASVLLIHHLRKSGGAEYTGSRGSGALSAFPDIIVELTRFDAGHVKDRKRVLRAKGRYDETPDELTIELDAGGYRAVVDPVALVATVGPQSGSTEPTTEEQRVVHVLLTNPSVWIGIDEIRKALRSKNWGLRNKDLNTVLFSLYSRNEILIRGVVRSKLNPREYALASRSTPGGVNGNEIGNETWEQEEDDVN
jgi:AAA domain/Bifunctional DNA primase/polymerase, N-terminal/Primase C terminal 1 (PriCT-1)